MKLVASKQERDLAAMLRNVLATECPPELPRSFKETGDRRVPGQLWNTLTNVGVLGLPFDEHYGGSSGSLDDLGVFFVEAGRVLCPTVVHSALYSGLAIDRLGDDAQRQRYLGRLCAGKLHGAIALWNPRDASDLRPTLTAERAPGGWRVSGTLDFVADADLADVLVVTAGTAELAEPRRTLGLCIDTTIGVRVEPLQAMAGRSLCRVVLKGVHVPESQVLPATGSGELRRLANTVVVLQCLDMVGGADAVLRRTVGHTTSRHQFGRPIGSFQAAQHLVANMHIALTSARLASRSALFWLGRGRMATRETAIARMHAATAYKRITLDAHQLHGGMGYVRETDLHLWSERARTFATIDGTAEVAAGWLRGEVGLG
ncbi:acyl-CoA dehydrogenase family protein [Amycolatopsis taiwanensis]|uniref:Isovaleryl-CoA dehydrogenase n=1 Tax=Amycolatopsis taiwanensis TaxID=342230 RepID=A0A9W6R939_9PSEU|nr:acyl-CoA dehydrogenase family protein [Amycolatopsis taiwanensis]GLY71309.1 isovaleryl-CoA dehydrogenase [Amycolatopsis taiwanensis]